MWDTFAHTPGKIANGDTGDIACDHYHRYREDVALMRELGLRAYRFSVSWPRVLTGRRRPRERGVSRFYGPALRRADGRAAGIVPEITLCHWDLPEALQERGGWGNRATIDAFVAYADVVSRRLADRVPLWITHNEPAASSPWTATSLGSTRRVSATIASGL